MATIVKDLGAVTAYAYAKEKGYTGTEDEFAELMASYADVAEQAAESAAQAGASATAAEQAKVDAALSASAAASSASTAITKASEAASSASSAAGSANTATTKASEASASATNAASSASAAATSATNAGASETAAASSATAASNAKTAAETAQGKAEDARAAADAAAQSVSESAAQITQNTEDVAGLKSATTSLNRNIVRVVEDGDMAFNLEWEQFGINSSDGADNTNAQCIRTSGYTNVEGVKTLYVSVDLTDFTPHGTETSCVFRVYEYSSESVSGFIANTERNPAIGTVRQYAFTLNGSTKFVRIMFGDWWYDPDTFPVSQGSRLNAFIKTGVPELKEKVEQHSVQIGQVSDRSEQIGYDAVANDTYHFPITWERGGIKGSDGTDSSGDNVIRSLGFREVNSRFPLSVKVDLTHYTLKPSGPVNVRVYEYSTNSATGFIRKTDINPSVGSTNEYVFNLDSDTKYVRFIFADWSITTMPASAGVDFVDIWFAGFSLADTIFTRNQALLENIYAGSDYYRQYPYSTVPNKLFTLMMISDIHGDSQRMANAIDLLNGCDAIDAGIVLGDVQVFKYDTAAMANYVSIFNGAKKPFYGVMGNHDFRQYAPLSTNNVTCEQATTYYLKALNSGSIYTNRGYGYVDFDTYKIRLIILNDYDYPDDNNGTDYVYYGDKELFQQGQIDWLVSSLDSTPEDYTVIIAGHYMEPLTVDNNAIDQHTGAKRVVNTNVPVGSTGFMGDAIIADIVNAFISKTSLSKSYTYTTQGSITGCNVSADFSGRTNALFGCYICGHRHKDAVGRITGYSDQVVYVNDTSCCSTPANVVAEYSLYPRNMNGASQDLVTVLSVDTDNKMINLTRIGAHRTFFMDNNSCVNYSYSE